MKKRGILVSGFLILFLMCNFVYAEDNLIDNIGFWDEGYKMEKIALGRVFEDVELKFDVLLNEDNLSSVEVDIDSISIFKGAPFEGNVKTAVCEWNDTTLLYNCLVSGIMFYAEDEDISLPLTITDGDNNKEETTINYVFEISTETPEVLSIKSGFCYAEDECYIRKGENNITIKIDGGKFEKGKVYFIVGKSGNRIIVNNCENNECYGLFNSNCDSDDKVSVYIASGSVDDYGNTVAGVKGVSFICDSDAPRLLNNNPEEDISFESSDEFGLIKGGDTLTITATIEEQVTKPEAKLNPGKLRESREWINGDCSETSIPGIYNCTFIVSGIENGYYKTNLEFNFTDGVGNLKSYTYYNIEVLKGIEVSEGIPDFFQVYVGKTIPDRAIDRGVLGLFADNDINYPVYVNYNIKRIMSSGNPKILYQEVDYSNCVYTNKKGETAVITRVFGNIEPADSSPEPEEYGEQRLNFEFENSVDTNNIDNNFSISCNISFTIATDDKYYKQPLVLEMKNMKFKLKSAELGTPGEQLGKKIEEAEDNYLVNGFYADTIDVLDKRMQELQTFCKVQNYINIVDMFAEALSITGYIGEKTAIDPITKATMRGVKETGTSKKTLTEKTSANIWTKVNGIVKTVCDWSSCSQTTETDEVLGSVDFSDDAWSDIKNIGGDLGTYFTEDPGARDRTNSILYAGKTKCFPAIIYHMNKYRQIQCQYIWCLKMQSSVGRDIAACERSRDYAICKGIATEFIEDVAPIIDNMIERAQNILDQSVTVLGAYGLKWLGSEHASNCEKGNNDFSRIFLCGLPESILMQIDYQAHSSKTAFQYPSTPDVCEFSDCENPEECYESNQDLWDKIGELGSTIDTEVITSSETSNPIEDKIRKVEGLAINTYTTTLNPDSETNKYYYYTENRGREINNYLEKLNDELELEGNKRFSPVGTEVSYDGKTYTGVPKITMEKLQNRLSDETSNLEYLESKFGKIPSKEEKKEEDKQKEGEELKLYADPQITNEAVEVYEDVKYCTHLKMCERMISSFDDNYGEGSFQKVMGFDDKEMAYLESGGFNDIYTQAEYKKENGEKLSDLEEKIFQMGEKVDNRQKAVAEAEYQSTKKIMDVLVGQVWDRFLGDWLSKKSYDWFHVGPAIEFLEQWKLTTAAEDICKFTPIFSGKGDTDSAIACTTEYCHPVLTYYATRAKLNDTHYAYALALYLGPLSDKDIEYNVWLRGDENVKVYDNFDWVKLEAGGVDIRQDSGVSENKYTQICVEFKEKFPPTGAGGFTIFGGSRQDKVWCREITEDSFNYGGEPYFEPEESSGGGVISGTGGTGGGSSPTTPNWNIR